MKILKFETSCCPQCKMQEKELLKIKDVPIEHINLEDDEDAIKKYKITKVPTIIVLSDEGRELIKCCGFTKYEDLRKHLDYFKNEKFFS